jgi:hypothetical protein
MSAQNDQLFNPTALGAPTPAAAPRRLGTHSPWTVSITHYDGSCGPGLDAVERLVGRVPAAPLCNVCFPGIRVWHLRRQSVRNGWAAHF